VPEVILHHYPQSPVSEKIRVALGVKGIDWRSVEIPRLPPKPKLMPLTGGYRLTPVMQIGADIYCDSLCILRQLENRFPAPTLFPSGVAGLEWGLARWTDDRFFQTVIAVVFGAMADDLPGDFAADRGLLYFGPGYDIAEMTRALAENLAQLRAQFDLIERQLADGREFMSGTDAGISDVLAYYLVWFIRGRYAGGPELLKQFEKLCGWEDRVRAIGHGAPTAMDADAALAVAKAAEPAVSGAVDPGDPQSVAAGDSVTVTPTGVSGAPSVAGRVLRLDAQNIVLHREDPLVGAVAVHFPRIGYVVRPA
jgi:glutathione S-transferase